MTCQPGECRPVDTPIPFGHRAPCPECPHVVCAVCGTLAEVVTPGELAEALMAVWDARPVKGQTSWLAE